MAKRILLIVGFLFFGIISGHSQKVGLVLSGGGAKGAVHIGIIKALEENDIPIDCISGTSIGAIVGSLYAMGYTPEEMLNLFTSEEFYYWQKGTVQEDYQFFFRKKRNEPDFMKTNIPLKKTGEIRNSILPNSLINPIQMNQAFMELFAQANAQCQGDFNHLFVPFLCISSNVYDKKAVISRNGDLGNAVRASMTFPFFFKPILKDSIPLFDGGIYNNFPVVPMKDAWNPDFIIGSSLISERANKPADQTMYDQMESIVMQHTDYRVDPEDGVLLHFTLKDVGLLDFDRAKELYDKGYKATIEMIDSIKNRIERRVPYSEIETRRAEYKASLPKLIFKDVYVTGTTNAQKSYIEDQILRNSSGEFTFNDFKKTYFLLLTNPKIKEILPRAVYDPEEEVFDLFLDIQMSDELTISFGGNVSSMSANQIYLGLSYQSLTDVSSNYDLYLQLGNTYSGVALGGKVEIPTTIPFDISGLIAYNNRTFFESKKLFIDTDISTFIRQRESYGRIGIGLPFLSKAKAEILVGYGELEDQYSQNTKGSYVDMNFDRSIYRLFNVGIHYTKNTLNAKQYAINGHDHHLSAQFISGKEIFKEAKRTSDESYSQSYIQVNAMLNNLHTITRTFNFGYIAEGVFSSKNLGSNYTASVLQAPAFTPTLHSKLVFNEAFRANQFVAGGITPIWKLSSIIHLRGDFDAFLPIYPIKRGAENKALYGELGNGLAYLGEVSLVAQLPFVSISLYTNYYSYPKENWNFGLNIGYLIFGPKFIP
jgi:NTE family protein